MTSATSERLENVRMIRESAAAVADEADLSRVRGLRFSKAGFDRSVWKTLGDMGWLGLRLPESDGGSSLGMVEFCALTRALGRGLTPEPLIEGVLAARMIGGEALVRLIAGQDVVVPAWPSEDLVFQDGKLNGSARFAPMAGGADAFAISVTGGAVLVDASGEGVSLTTQSTQDGGNVGQLRLDDASATFFPGDASQALDEATLATAANLLGVMERAFEISLDYLRTRQQFGKPIGAFQALQHKAADLQLQIALSDASINSAAQAWDNGAEAHSVSAAVSRAKARASEAAMRVTREAIQLHGAIGYTDEADISLFVRKAMTLANRYGSAADHRARRITENLTAGALQ